MGVQLSYKDIMRLSTKLDRDWRMTGTFNEKAWPRKGAHTGIDFGMQEGTVLYAMFDAEITAENFGVKGSTTTNTGSLANDYGNWTMYYVPALNRTYMDAHTLYGASVVNVGEIVKAGEKITRSGNTGMSTGPHLHRTVAKGRHTTLQSLFANAIDFTKDTPTVNEGNNNKGGEILKPYSAQLAPGTILYDRNGNAYSKPTTNTHTVTVYEEHGNLRGFSASWLVGVDVAYFKVSDNKPQPPAAPKYRDRKGQTVTIVKMAVLYNSAGQPYSLRTTRDHQVKVTGQIGDGIAGSTLLKFSASWLQGVDHAYVCLENVR